MSKTIAELAKEALDVQNACNLSGVVHSFSRVMSELCKLVPDTDQRNTHPIAVMFSSKISSLTGSSLVDFSRAYDECVKLVSWGDK